MSKRKPNHTLEKKLNIVLEVVNEHKSISSLSRHSDISKSSIKRWVTKYKTSGVDGLKAAKTWQRYSEAIKLNAVNDYLNRQGSYSDICKKYHISSHSVLVKWIKKYTGGKQLKSTGKGRSPMTNGRKTTFKERLEIVQYTIANEMDYQRAAEKYQVSYQQVYTWVRKYKAKGDTGLADRRGKGLASKPDLTEAETLQLRIKELEHRNQYLEAEQGLIKKLKEIERRDQHN